MSYPIDVEMAVEKMTTYQMKLFIECIDLGTAPRLAAMLALQSPPSCQTADTVLAQYGANNNQFADDQETGEMLVAKAKQYDPNFSPVGKVYIGGLCPHGQQGHPSAWVSGDLRPAFRKACDERGLNCEGVINYKGTVRDEKLAENETPYRVADDVVIRHTLDAVKADPSLEGKKDLLEMVRDKITPKDIK